MAAEYEVRKLYDVSTVVGPESMTYESMWAYYIRYPGSDHSTPGRFRIRITRMTSSEFLAMMGIDEENYDASGAYSIQGYVEKWSDKGWLQCLDWIGAPGSLNKKIEQDLLSMYEAFTTGQPTTIDSSDFPFPPRAPQPPKKPKNPYKTPTLIQFPGKGTKDATKPNNETSGSDPGFDWI